MQPLSNVDHFFPFITNWLVLANFEIMRFLGTHWVPILTNMGPHGIWLQCSDLGAGKWGLTEISYFLFTGAKECHEQPRGSANHGRSCHEDDS